MPAPRVEDYSVVPGSLGPLAVIIALAWACARVGTPMAVSSTFRRPCAPPALG
jgi:hypothetical protein